MLTEPNAFAMTDITMSQENHAALKENNLDAHQDPLGISIPSNAIAQSPAST